MLGWIADFLRSLGIAEPSGIGWLSIVFVFVLAALCSSFAIPHVRSFGMRTGCTDAPESRRLNREPVPNVGGLAIFAAVLTALVLATLLRSNIIDEVKVYLLAILSGGGLLVLVGFIDDQYGLSALLRLAVQLLAASLLVAVGIRVRVTFGGSLADVYSGIFTVLWVMAITNALNLIDGVDGLAGGVGLITALCLVAVSAQDPARAAASLVLAGLAGAAFGFLRHNLRPGFIIMGDSGAYFFGYTLGASSILGTLSATDGTASSAGNTESLLELVPMMLFLLIPVIDTSQVIAHRLRHRRNPLSSPGRDHLHHRLIALGLSQRATTFLLWGATLIANLGAMRAMRMPWVVILVTALGVILLLVLASLSRTRSGNRMQ